MTDFDSLNKLAYLLRTIPGVESSNVFRCNGEQQIQARVRCRDIKAVDLLARCATAANTLVTVAEIDARLCCEATDTIGLPCDIRFADSADELPIHCQRYGFFIAKALFSRGIIERGFLDELEHRWNVCFSRGSE